MRACIVIGLFGIAGCGTAVAPDGGSAVDVGVDARAIDGGTDASAMDTSAMDGGHDAAIDDAGNDAASLDANDLDAASPSDAGLPDAWITRTGDSPTHPSATPIAPFSECTVTTFTDTTTSADHTLPCAVIPYPFHPPSAGPHYESWAAFRTYDAPVPWGFLVHDLQHGSLVLAYHCENDADCDPVRAEMASIVADHGLDPVCRLEDTPTRFIVVPDPELPVPIAAVGWGHVYEATCLDPVSLRAFVDAHYGMGTETYCGAGVDRADAGWCP
jgi:hypothetical protein